MNGPLSVETPMFSTDGKNAFVPYIRMNIQALSPGESETHEVLRLHIITGQSQWSQKGFVHLGEEQLPAIWMIVGVPDQQFLWRAIVIFFCLRRIRCVAQNVMPVDRIISSVKDITLPFADEDSFRRTAFITAVGINWSPALSRPSYDFDIRARQVGNEAAKSLQCILCGVNNRYCHPSEIRWNARIQIVGRSWHSRSGNRQELINGAQTVQEPLD